LLQRDIVPLIDIVQRKDLLVSVGGCRLSEPTARERFILAPVYSAPLMLDVGPWPTPDHNWLGYNLLYSRFIHTLRASVPDNNAIEQYQWVYL